MRLIISCLIAILVMATCVVLVHAGDNSYPTEFIQKIIEAKKQDPNFHRGYGKLWAYGSAEIHNEANEELQETPWIAWSDSTGCICFAFDTLLIPSEFAKLDEISSWSIGVTFFDLKDGTPISGTLICTNNKWVSKLKAKGNTVLYKSILDDVVPLLFDTVIICEIEIEDYLDTNVDIRPLK